MDKRLIDIIACPLCKSPLVLDKGANELLCKADHLAFPIQDGVLVLLESEARTMPPGEDAAGVGDQSGK